MSEGVKGRTLDETWAIILYSELGRTIWVLNSIEEECTDEKLKKMARKMLPTVKKLWERAVKERERIRDELDLREMRR